ncbi:MAG: methanogenesis marker protein 6 [Candidatus Methanoplasma sp.]|jgi:putative methanogenesis marker protein 6|nr:methanogenesis marker protein 6 [Candidatus Methanoplasma sp.]
MSEERETRIFMISPDSMITPDQLVREVHAMGKGVTAKETCYGTLAEGPRALVREVLADLREKHPYDIYSKVRAYPTGDPRRCRAQHGTRPGFAQLEAEWEILPRIGYGLRCCGKGETYETHVEKKSLPVEEFKKICEAIR